jgi:beta-lactam-binding protein with PASTA domain/predicted Ser/Thr protein kinase
MAEIAPHTLIDDRYLVVRRLGTGGMADVFLVKDQQLNRNVALKLLHRRFAEDPAFVERFRREAQSAAGLQHQNIVGVYDRGEFDGTYYIAMEYLPGRTLKDIIRDEAPLEPVRAIDIALQILKAARFAHRRGIVHRDLKPHNVMVDDAGDAKVTDFGIARAGPSDMTETGSIMGTAQYLSPEQAQGHSVTASSDLYSVGVVLYEMLTGSVPFDGEAAVTIALKHVSEAPIPPRQLNPRIPVELEQTVLWTLNKNAADRPADADQLITVLEHIRDAIVEGAAGRHTASMAAVAAGAAAGMPVEGLPEVPPVSQPVTNGSGQLRAVHFVEEVEPEEQQGRGWRPWLWGLLVLVLVCAAAAAAYFLSRPDQVVVPSVTDESFNIARTRLQNAGFDVKALRVRNAKPVGTVFAESPSGGNKADKGSTVTVTVSTGRGKVSVPSVQGESAKQARALLKRFGLSVQRVIQTPSSRFPAGQATGTSPRAATSVPHGTPVALFVSTGPQAKAIPDVTGETQGQATADLSNAGFKVHSQHQVSTTTPSGHVISQTPTQDKTARPGSTVTIVVAKAQPTATVPPVTGDPSAGAASALRSQGFEVATTTRPVSDPSRNRTVIAQNPPGGSRRPRGSTVTIVIGIATQTITSSSTTTATRSSTTTTKTTSTPTTSTSTSTTTTSTLTTPTNGAVQQGPGTTPTTP